MVYIWLLLEKAWKQRQKFAGHNRLEKGWRKDWINATIIVHNIRLRFQSITNIYKAKKCIF